MKMTFAEIHRRCLSLKSIERAKGAARFFKTGKGEYGEGDQFYGITVPETRSIAKEFQTLSMDELRKLFQSKIHEERLVGIHILNLQYSKAIKRKDEKIQKLLYKNFFKWRKGVNNWDLVDSIAPYLSGHYYFHQDSNDLYKLVKSKNLWERRISILSCFYFIRQKNYEVPLKIIEHRLYDKEDLMHKACGWMLREIGSRDQKLLFHFLNEHAPYMPRTALRYSIEKLNPNLRSKYLSMKNK